MIEDQHIRATTIDEGVSTVSRAEQHVTGAVTGMPGAGAHEAGPVDGVRTDRGADVVEAVSA
ncbi:hypothetical protein [Agromyces salentinus]|uniref:Asp23/Gls24 family envelope stress response protein n=1 Tax=Agromyces salentinus TaxID=269421 RepID=A0ABP4YPH2_9MICO|nr:hypothetical protein [Agromyces salentinus]